MKRYSLFQAAKVAVCGMMLVGCAQIPKGAGFPDVQRTVAQRIGEKVTWPRDADATTSVKQAVDKLLQMKLTPNATVRIALLNNRDLQAVYENLGIAQAQLVAAGLIPNPVFDGALKFDLSDSAMITELSVAQDFLGVLFIPLHKKIAAGRFEQTKLNVSVQVLALAGRTRRAFYRLQAQSQLTAMLGKVVHAARYAYEMVQRLHEAGNIPQIDVDRQRALYQQTKLALASAQAATFQLREELNRLMGLWGSQTKWIIADPLPAPPTEPMQVKDLENRVITASLDLAQARQGVNALGRKLGLSGLAGMLDGGGLGVAAEHDPGESWALGPSLSIPIPLFNMGQPALAQARAKVRQAFDSYTALAVDIRSQARALRSQLLTERRKVIYYRDQVLPLRRRITQRMQLQYNAMQVGVFELLRAKRQEIDAGRQYIQVLLDYWLTRSKLEQLLAGSTPAAVGPSEGVANQSGLSSLGDIPTIVTTETND